MGMGVRKHPRFWGVFAAWIRSMQHGNQSVHCKGTPECSDTGRGMAARLHAHNLWGSGLEQTHHHTCLRASIIVVNIVAVRSRTPAASR